MGLYKYDNGVLIPIAGRGKAEYGASTTRYVTWTNAEAIAVGGSVPFSAVFDVPMPDANYEVNWTCSASALHPVIDEKTASGFTGHAYRLVSPAVDSGNGVINFTAFRLYTDLEYNELLDDTEGLIKNTTESGVVNQFETTIHTQRYNKVIYTVNDDGTIALEIIQRPDTNTGLSIGLIDVKAGETYKLTGGLSANERLELKNMDYSAWTNNTVNKAVSSPIVDTNVDTFMPNADATLRVYLRIDASGNTGNVGTIEPMIRFASFLDDTFIPYAKTNRLLTVETDELFANAAMLKGMTEITAQTDLDDVTTIGEYYKSSTSIYVTNAPAGIDSETSAIFRLKVENGSDSTTFVQTIVEDDGTTYKRGYDGTTWSTWAEFASSSSVSGLDTRLTTAETDIDNLETSRLKTYTSDSTVWDTTPTALSTNPVTSDGIKSALDEMGSDAFSVMGENGAKNLLRYPYVQTTQTIYGVTFTDNRNGTLTINGTQDGSQYMPYFGCGQWWETDKTKSNILLKKGNSFIASINSSDNNIGIRAFAYNASGTSIFNNVVYGNQELTIGSFSENAYIAICVETKANSSTIDNVTVYPMLRLASDADANYQPYAMTNQQLTPIAQSISNPNLLDNPWFTVNQRGASSYSAGAYTVDRWILGAGALEARSTASPYIVLQTLVANTNAWMRQKTEFDLDTTKEITYSAIIESSVTSEYGFSLKMSNMDDLSQSKTKWFSTTANERVVISMTELPFKNTAFEVVNNSQANASAKVYALKVELGSVSTLANDTAPNYAEELAKCQRYFVRYASTANNSSISFGAIATVNKQWYGVISLPVVMRAVPTITYNGTVLVYFEANSALNQNISSIAISNMMANVGKLRANFADTTSLTVGMTGELQLQNGAYIDLSADL